MGLVRRTGLAVTAMLFGAVQPPSPLPLQFPFPILTSCFVFPIIGFACGTIPLFLLRTKRLGKDDAQITCLSIGVAIFCMWLMWLCAWMHQWNPIILPYVSHPPVGMGGDESAVGEHR